MQNVAALAVRIGADISELDKGLAKAERSLFWFGNSVTALGKKLTLGLTLPLVAAGAAAVKVAADMDSLRRGMIAVTGSAGAADAQIRRLREVAKLPGLGFAEAVQGAINLQAAGFSAEMAERSLRAFGNALATVGKGKAELDGVITALSQIQSKGKVSAEEINQLAERLPQIRVAMQAAFGTSNTEALQEMGVTAEVFVEKVVGEFEKLRQATGGAKNSFANLSESMKIAAASAGQQLLPVAIALTDTVTDLFDALGRLNPQVVRWGVALATTLALVGPLVTAFGALAKVLVLVNAVRLASAFASWAAAIPALAAAIGVLRTALMGMAVTLGVGGAIIAGLALVSTWFIKNKLDALAARDAAQEYGSALENIGKAQTKTQFNIVDSMLQRGGLSRTERDSLIAERERLGEQLRSGGASMLSGITVTGSKPPEPPDFAAELRRLEQRMESKRSTFRGELGTRLATGTTYNAGRNSPNPFGPNVPALVALGGVPVPNAGTGAGGVGMSAAGQAMSMVAESAMGLVSSFSPLSLLGVALSSAFEAMQPAIDALLMPVRALGALVGGVVNKAMSYLAEGIGHLIKAIGWVINKINIFGGDGGIGKFGQEMIDAARAARAGAQATKDATTATQKFAESLSNVPNIVNLPALRRAIEQGASGGSTGGYSGPGGVGGPGKPMNPPIVINGDLYFNDVQDVRGFLNEMGVVARRTISRGGTPRIALTGA